MIEVFSKEISDDNDAQKDNDAIVSFFELSDQIS